MGRVFSRRAGACFSEAEDVEGSAAGAGACSSRGDAVTGWRAEFVRSLAGAGADSGRPAGSSFMMLTGGIEAAEGSVYLSGMGARVSDPVGAFAGVAEAAGNAAVGVRQAPA